MTTAPDFAAIHGRRIPCDDRTRVGLLAIAGLEPGWTATVQGGGGAADGSADGRGLEGVWPRTQTAAELLLVTK